MLKRAFVVVVVVVTGLSVACDEPQKAERGPSRFNGVKRAQGDAARSLSAR